MTPINKNPSDPYGNSYGTGDTSGAENNTAPQTKAYGEEGYDPGMGDEGYDSGMGDGYEDEFLYGDEEIGGGEGSAPPVDLTPQGLRDLANEHKDALGDQYSVIWGRINAAAGMSPDKMEAELSAIAGEINNVIYPPDTGVDGEMGEGEQSTDAVKQAADDFKRDLESYRGDVEGMENLTEEEKTEFLGAIDKMINDIELAGDDPARLADLDVEGMKAELTELQTAVDAGNQHPQSVKSLAELAGLTPEELAAKAEAKGIDLSNVPVPPTMEIFEFLKEISPELKQKIDAVATAVSERTDFGADALRAANQQIDSNDHGDTSAADDQSPDNIQHLLDYNYFQDDKSKAVKEAMKAVSEALQPLLESLYPGQEVKLVESTGVSGWEKDQQDFLNADKISIGGTVIDLFGATDGMMHSSTTADEPAKIEIPTIKYDGSGDGAWKPAKSWFNLYGETDLKTQATDEAETYSGTGLA